MYERALSFLNKLDSLGFVGYIVGGYPRDKYLGFENSDIDICTNMKPNELKEHFDVIESFDKYGSVRIKYEDSVLEVTTFRKDGRYKDFRRPDSVEFVDTLEEDIKRRDFVINTLCIDKDGNYIDLLGARKDIDNKIIRVVGNIEKKLTEDPLRIIRALRFSVMLNFELEEELKKYIDTHGKDILKVTDFRKNIEFSKLKNKETKLNLQTYMDKLTK